MTGTPPAVTVSLLRRMLVEAFEGPRGPWTYFTDASPGTGIFATLGGLSATQASQPGGPGHSTVAGHIHHVSASLALSTRGLRGERSEEHTSELQSHSDLVCRLLLEKKKKHDVRRLPEHAHTRQPD